MKWTKRRKRHEKPEFVAEQTRQLVWFMLVAGVLIGVFGTAYLPGAEIPINGTVVTFKPYPFIGMWLISDAFRLWRLLIISRFSRLNCSAVKPD